MALQAVRLPAAALLFPLTVFATDCRFTLGDQSNYSANTGFYLDLENTPTGGASYCALENMTIALGDASGSQWRFIVANPQWRVNHTYTAQAVIAPTYFELSLDGQLLGHVATSFAGLPHQDLLANSVPGWADGAGNYLVTQSSLEAAAGNQPPVNETFASVTRPLPLVLFAPGSISQSVPFSFAPADTLTITATFSLSPVSANIQSYAPYVDGYGQSIYATFDGKIQSDADLQSAAAEEQTMLAQWGVPTGYDAWGGVLNAGWQDTATGFFHVVRHNHVWWLISPAGNPCFFIGLDNGPLVTGNNAPVGARQWEFAALPPQVAPYDAAWSSGDWGDTGITSVSFDTWNMIRKYGSNWEATATNLTLQRMSAWGFSGFGKWSTATASVPILPVLEPYNVPDIAQHPDIFDAGVQTAFQKSLQQQIAPFLNNSSILGWSFGNEIDQIILSSEVTSILGMSSAVPAKQALINHALASIYSDNIGAMATAWGVTAATVSDLYASSSLPPIADVEELREYYEDQYYAFIGQTVKAIDPNHLFFGFWIVPGWWADPVDWQLQAAHVDVVGYDYYSAVFEDSLLHGLIESTDKPVFTGEYSFPPTYNLLRGYEAYPLVAALDDQDAGARYANNMQAAARNPWCVGIAWFEYRDEPIAGRGYAGVDDLNLIEGEDYAFGMVDVADRPKYDLVNQVRTANLSAAARRLSFAAPNLNPGGVVNNASFAAAAPVAPGSLVSIFGSNLADPIQPGATSLTLNRNSMPLIDAFPLQIDAQIPWETSGQSSATLSIVTDDLSGNTISVPLAPYAPGIYTTNAAGTGQGAILLNGTAIVADSSHPVARGDYINIFATGLGPVSNQPATGAPGPLSPLAQTFNPVTVTIGGISATAPFAGLAPGFTGLYQVNAQIPAAVTPGNAVPLVISIGNVVSNQVTLAVAFE